MHFNQGCAETEKLADRNIFLSPNFSVSAVFSAFIAALRLNWPSLCADHTLEPQSSIFYSQSFILNFRGFLRFLL